ncbi:hypothetical protein TNCV_4320691 [Trichonephila clavipes]|nr:hypothetical protein TNCV_4320691 [Trichonephila clavipes]
MVWCYMMEIYHTSLQRQLTPPSGTVVSDADCGAVGHGFESRRRMDVCKCIMPLWHGGTLNSRRAASPLVRSVEERWEAPELPPKCSLSKLGWNRAK